MLFTCLIVFALRPEVRAVSEQGRLLADDPSTLVQYQQLLFPLVLGPSLLVTAMTLAVFKPWGLIRRAGASSYAAQQRARG